MKKYHVLFAVALALVAMVVLPQVAQAQGGVVGSVTDHEGNPVPAVKMRVKSMVGAPLTVRCKSNKRGDFKCILPPNKWDFEFTLEKEGYATKTERHQFLLLRTGETSVDQDFQIFPEGHVPSTGGGLAEGADPTDPANAAAAAGVSNDAINAFNAGVAAFESGDYAAAKASFAQALEKDPNIYQAHAATAEILLKEKNYEGAVAAAETALGLSAAHEPALRVRYEAYKELGDNAKAKEAQEALQAVGRSSDAAKKIYNEGVELNKTGDVDAAIAKFQEAASMDPTLKPAYEALGILYITSEQFEKAAEAASSVLALDPTDARALRMRFDALKAAGDSDELTEAAVALAAVEKDFAAAELYNRGVRCYNENDFAGAAAMFEAVLKADPNYAKGMYYLGLSSLNTGDTALAKAMLQKFVEVAPDDPDAANAKEMIGYL